MEEISEFDKQVNTLAYQDDVLELKIQIGKEAKMGRRYYTYVLWTIDGTPFYVGKGTKNRCMEHYHAFSKDPKKDIWHLKNKMMQIHTGMFDFPIIEIDKFFEDEQDAYSREIDLIAKYGTIKNGNGTLTNLTLGGAGGFDSHESAVSAGVLGGSKTRSMNSGIF